MLDLHAHVLPGIDDGPRTLEEALALVQALADDGVEHVVATPHIYPGVFDNTAARIGETFDSFQDAVTQAGIALTMSWAAEVRICPEILDWIEQRRLPMLNGSLVGPSTALIELPDGQIPVGTDKLMGMMLDRGITPLMAHPERNKAVMEQPTRLEALRRLGCKFQVTAGSLLGDFGTRAQSTAQRLLDAGWVDVVASDAHNRSGRRPRMGAARDWLTTQYDADFATRLTRTQPTEIAGVSSFAVEAAGQRLVFRDLPVNTPVADSDAWSMDLGLGPAAELDSPLGATKAAASTAPDAWSLIDFRIDAVVSDLQQATLQTDPGVGLDAAGLPPAAATPQDWLLPDFGMPVPVSAPVPAPTPAPAPAAVHVQAAAPAVPPEPSPPPPPPPAVTPPRPVPVTLVAVQVAPPVLTADAADKGLRLSEVAPRVVEAVPAPTVARLTPAPGVRSASLAQAGAQHEQLPRPVDVPTRVAATADSLTEVARSLTAAARQTVHEAPALPPAVPPAPTGEAAPRGFRLSDLNPLPSRRR